MILNKENEYDVILLDIIMPKKDGVSILEEMNKLSLNKKVIVLTSYNTQDMIRKVSELGVNYFILRRVNNNFSYEYLRDYKEYYKNNPKYYNKIKYMVFIKETLFNIYRYFWSKKKNKNTDDLWEKQFNLIGKYFNKNKKNKPINLDNWFVSNLENYF